LRFHAAGSSAACHLDRRHGPGLGIKRPLLDEAVLNRAGKAGVDVVLGVTVTGLREAADGRFDAAMVESGVFPARVIVAADGLRPRLRRQAGLDRAVSPHRYGVGAHATVLGNAGDCVDVYVTRDHEVYVTPVSASEVNIALLVGESTARTFAGRVRERF